MVLLTEYLASAAPFIFLSPVFKVENLRFSPFYYILFAHRGRASFSQQNKRNARILCILDGIRRAAFFAP